MNHLQGCTNTIGPLNYGIVLYNYHSD